ncbi:MAG: hypothetical protein ACOC85_01130 [Thermoplasmatota archaeon]
MATEGDGVSESIAFYIDHGDYSTEGWVDRWYYIHDDSGNIVTDDSIYDNTLNYPNPKFVLLWSCWQGNEIGGIREHDTYDDYAYGMPFAWLRADDLSEDGYNNPDFNGYAFAGFITYAPFLGADLTSLGNDSYEFLKNFYTIALEPDYDYNIKQELNDASKKTWRKDFEDSVLRDDYYKVIYGDGSEVLSPYVNGGGGGGYIPPGPRPTGDDEDS